MAMKHNPGAPTPPEVQITALAYAETFGPAAAGRKFNLHPKTLSRWKKQALSGTAPLLLQAIEAERAKVALNCRDILQTALETFAQEAIKRTASMKNLELLEGLKVIGELSLAKDNLKKPGEAPNVGNANNKPDYSIPEDEGSTNGSSTNGSGDNEPELVELHPEGQSGVYSAQTSSAHN